MVAEPDFFDLEQNRSAIRASIVKLLTNWGKNALGKQIDAWTDNAIDDGFTPDEVERGVKACIRNWKEPNGPQGYANFAQYLPKSRMIVKDDLPWYGEQGDWGGDWKNVHLKRWLTVAAIFTANMRPSRVEVPTTTVDEKGKETVKWNTVLRKTMDDAAVARCEEFLKLARRHRLSQPDIDAAAKAFEKGRLTLFVAQWWQERHAKQGNGEPQGALTV